MRIVGHRNAEGGCAGGESGADSEADTKSSTEDTDPNDETPRTVETSQSEDPIDTPIADPDGEDLDGPDDKTDDGIDDPGLDNTAESEDDQGQLADKPPEENGNQETGEEKLTIKKAHSREITTVLFSPDGKRILTQILRHLMDPIWFQ